MFAERVVSLFGLFGMVGIAWILSEDRRSFPWRVATTGILLQLLIGLVVLSPEVQQLFFVWVDAGVRRLLSFSEAGADFAFQTVEPHQIMDGAGVAHLYIGRISPPVKTFAFWIIPSILFFSSLMAITYHLGVMQWVVKALAWVMQRNMRTSGAETLSATANIFLGQTEAPLMVRPYIAAMTRSELFCVMVGGFANVAGGVLAAYVSFLKDIPGIAGHLVTCSILSAPATLVIAKVMIPEKGRPVTSTSLDVPDERPDRNVMEAAARGATEGMSLALNVVGMLIAFVALAAMIDAIVGLAPVSFCDSGVVAGRVEGCGSLSMSRVLGWLFTPLAAMMGVPWAEAGRVGALLGEKIVLTELIAYLHLGEIMKSADPLSPRAAVIASYALCGFANFASIGIQLGGIGALAPERRGELAEIALRAMIGGSLATFMCACVAGILI